MHLYQILKIHFRPWTFREIICFGMLILLTLAVVCFLLWTEKIVWTQAVSGILMVCCLSVIFASTVFTRMPEIIRQYELNVFWSWREVLLHRNRELLEENLLNLFLLFPVGVLLPPMVNKKLTWWKGLLAGIMVSVTIELFQLMLFRGLFEWDDIIHNSLGCMAGCMLSGMICKFRKSSVI